MPSKKFFIILSIIYVLAIYTSSGWMRELAGNIRQMAGVWLDIAVTVGLCAFLFGVLHSRRSFISGRRLIPLALVLGGYSLAFWYLRVPEERMHLLQYGLLSFFCSGALPERIGGFYRFLLVIGLVTVAGIGDEYIQYLRPNRVGDFRDVLVNCLAALLAQALQAVIARTDMRVEILQHAQTLDK